MIGTRLYSPLAIMTLSNIHIFVITNLLNSILDHYNYFHHRLDDEENIAGICLNEGSRDPLLRLPEEDVLAFYRAMKAYTNIIHHADNLFKYKMNNGKILLFSYILYCIIIIQPVTSKNYQFIVSSDSKNNNFSNLCCPRQQTPSGFSIRTGFK